MKIHQLPLGARFDFEGQEYVKTGPMFANGPGGQRLIPRYAVLKPLDGLAPVESDAPAGAALPRAEVLAALEIFCRKCRELVPKDRWAEMEVARDEFLKAVLR